MRTTNTFGIIFCLRKNRIKNGKVPIYIRITVDSKRSEIALKRYIEIENWNDLKGTAKSKSEELRQLNTYLEQIRSRLVVCYQELQLKNKLITAKQ